MVIFHYSKGLARNHKPNSGKLVIKTDYSTMDCT